MTQTETTLLKELRSELQDIQDLNSTAAILDWDQATYMPEKGATARGRKIALLGRLAHERVTAPRMVDLIGGLRHLEEADDAPTNQDAILVREARRDHEKAMFLPTEFVIELKNHLAASYVTWTQARPDNDFKTVLPLLEKTLELSRKKAGFYPDQDHIADPLIDQMDRGMKTQTIRDLFQQLRSKLVPLVEKITSAKAPDDSCLNQPYAEEQQLAFGKTVIQAIGYDFKRGRQDKTHHPFMTRFSGGDIRITTRVDPDNLKEALFSSIHEAGHALYELNIRPDLDGTLLGHGVSAGVHESQSRLWENLVGRSRPFWNHFYEPLQQVFPQQLGNVDLETFYRAVNRVERTLVRTAADEVTYNLHVMMRFDLEIEMLEGKLAVKDLPDAWRARMKSDLRCEPADDRDGVMQDVHWYCETIGGLFQGYTLGNMMSAQFFAAAQESLDDVHGQIAEGNFAPLREWLTKEVYQYGRCVAPMDLVKQATGKTLSVDPFIDYLNRKYSELYEL